MAPSPARWALFSSSHLGVEGGSGLHTDRRQSVLLGGKAPHGNSVIAGFRSKVYVDTVARDVSSSGRCWNLPASHRN